MITVANVKTYRIGDAAPGATPDYIGRAMPGRPGSPLGNPFKLAKGESREACVAKYAHWLQSLPAESAQRQELARLTEIARKGDLILLCWCAPEKCHGDVIKEIIEAELKRPQWTRPLVSEITATDGQMMSITLPATDGPVILSSIWEVSQAKALDLMTTDRNFWRSYFEESAADGFSAIEQSIVQRTVALSEECDALRDKAAAFDVMSERVQAGKWHVGPGSIGHVLIDVMTTGERVYAPTLAEAIRLAMEAEGER